MVPKHVSDRLVRSIGKFRDVLNKAKARDANESDTASIVRDILAEVFGYDKFLEISAEFPVKRTRCDLAIRVENKVEYLVEVKAIGHDLKEDQKWQAIDYGAKCDDVPWVILTNGMEWRVYRIRGETPIISDLVCSFSFADADPKNEESQEKLFILCKEGLVKDARERFHDKAVILDRFVLGAFIISEEVVRVIRRELRKFSEGKGVTPEEITKVLKNEVLKREILDGEEAAKAQSRVRQFFHKAAKGTKDKAPEKPPPEEQHKTVAESALPGQVENDTEESAESTHE